MGCHAWVVLKRGKTETAIANNKRSEREGLRRCGQNGEDSRVAGGKDSEQASSSYLEILAAIFRAGYLASLANTEGLQKRRVVMGNG